MKSFSYRIPAIAVLVSLSLSVAAQTAQDWFTKAKEFKSAKKYTEAIDAYKKATVLKKDYYDAWNQMAWCYNELEDYASAEVAGKQAVKFKSNYAEAWMETAYAQRKQKKYTDALASVKNAIRYKDGYTNAILELGHLYKDQKDYNNALMQYKTALLAEPKNAEANYQAGWVNNANAKFNDAIPYLRMTVSLNAKYHQAYQELGYAFYKTAQYDSAESNYKKAIAVKPDYAAPYRGLGDVYRLGKKPIRVEDALNQYRTSLKYDSTNALANFGLGWCYNEQKLYVLASQYLENAAKLSPNDPTVRSELGYSYYARGLYKEGINQFKQGIQINSNHKFCHYYAGLCYLELKDKTNAQAMYEKLKTIDGTLAQKLLDLINKM